MVNFVPLLSPNNIIVLDNKSVGYFDEIVQKHPNVVRHFLNEDERMNAAIEKLVDASKLSNRPRLLLPCPRADEICLVIGLLALCEGFDVYVCLSADESADFEHRLLLYRMHQQGAIIVTYGQVETELNATVALTSRDDIVAG